VLESYVTKRRNKAAALKFLKKVMKRYGKPEITVTDKCPSYRAAMKNISNQDCQEVGRHKNNRAKIASSLQMTRTRYAQISANEQYANGRHYACISV